LSKPDDTDDGTSLRFDLWRGLFAPLAESTEAILEIGSREGRSAAFFLSYFTKASIVCIDSFEDGTEHAGPDAPVASDMESVEKRFDANLDAFGARMRKFKGSSLVMLDQLNRLGERFDLIHIGGDHAAASVLADAALAWPMLRPGGILIFDDYGWMPQRPAGDRPGPAVDAFLNLVRSAFEELHRGDQVIVRKVAAPARDPGEAKPSLPATGLAPPLVSFVVISWNYARFVGETIRSIRMQDYPDFECIVVDNASIDDSRAVIEESIRGDDRFRSVYLPENIGQLGAAVGILDRLKGSYVSFVDSDDVIFANYASMHVQAHLGFSTPVALTTNAIVEMNAAGQVIQFRDYRPRMKAIAGANGLRPLDDMIRLPHVSETEYRRLSDASLRAPPRTRGWIWSPGTANMFRRSALEWARIGDGAQKLMRPADEHFNRVCHALAGTGIINLTLSAYRIHGSNAFASHEKLEAIHTGTVQWRNFAASNTAETFEHILASKDRYIEKMGGRYFSMVTYFLDELGDFKRDPRVKAAIGRHVVELQRLFGAQQVNQMVLSRYGSRVGLEILLGAGALRLSNLRPWYFRQRPR
jgi:glycosyltransferase involved in cell wall biosynthesis/predicted O-methyltransferase YrrM